MHTRHCDHPSHRKEETPLTAIAEVVAWKYVPKTINGQVAYKHIDVCDSHVWWAAKKLWDEEVCERVDIRGLLIHHRCEACLDYIICGRCGCRAYR